MNSFREGLRHDDFVITAQLPLTSGSTADDVRNTLQLLRSAVHAVQISDNVTTRPHMSPVAAACLALQSEVDPVVHMNCRDRNRIALQSDLMGAAAIGVTSFVLSRGEKLPAEHKQRIKGVFDIGAQRLLATAQAISANERLVAPPGLFAGSNVAVIDPPEDWAAAGIDSKILAGSRFLQTQACLDVPVLRRYMSALVRLKALEQISLIVQVPLLTSKEMLVDLQKGRRPLLIAPELLARLDQSSDIAAEGEDICCDILSEVASVPGVSGANILWREDPEALLRVLSTVTRKESK